MNNLLCQNILMLILYILFTRWFDTFWSGVIETAQHIKSKQKTAILAKIFWTKPTFQKYFSAPKFFKLLILHTSKTTYYLSNPVLSNYPSRTCLFPSPACLFPGYTTCTNATVRLNLNYKKLVECINTTTFLRMNLNKEKPKDVLILLSCVFLT